MTDRELNKKLDQKFQHIINFIAIQVVLTLILMGLVGTGLIELKPIFKASQSELIMINENLMDIHADFMIFQDGVEYSAEDAERMEGEKAGNFNEYDNVEFEVFGIEEDEE